MWNVFSIFNYKGGVGKTTIALNIAMHLGYKLYEVKKDYIFEINKEDDQGCKKELYDPLPYCNRKMDFDEDSVVDVNCINDTLPAIIKASTKVIVPTLLDMKDIVKTIASIEYIKKMNPDCSIVLIVNNLNSANEKSSEIKYSKKLIHEVNTYTKLHFQTLDTELKEDGFQYMTAIPKYSILYMRHNKIYFEYSHHGKFYLDSFINENHENYEDIIKNDCFSRYFVNNNYVLEALFQYHFYYGDLYRAYNEEKAIEDKKTNKTNKTKTPYQLGDKIISRATSNFVKTDFPMLSEDEDFFNAMKSVSELTSTSPSPSTSKIYKSNPWKESEIDRIQYTADKNSDDFMKKEKFLHTNIKKFLHLKEANDHARTLKDFRILLCLLEVYDVQYR
jgi:hypothetical protein